MDELPPLVFDPVPEDDELLLIVGVLSQADAAWPKVKDLHWSHFGSALNGRIWQAATAALEAGTQPRPELLIAQGVLDSQLELIGGYARFLGLAIRLREVPPVWAEVARVVAECALRRQWRARVIAGQRRLATDLITPATTILAALRTELGPLEAELAQLSASALAATGYPAGSAADVAERVARRGNQVPALATGITGLDDALGGGLARGRLYVIGGPTTSGKSLLGGAIAYNLARQGYRVLLRTLEMPATDLFTRLCAAATGLGAAEQTMAHPAFVDFVAAFAALPLTIDDSGSTDPAPLLARAGEGWDAVIVDYVQRFRMPRTERVEFLSEVTAGHQAAAKAADLAWIDLAQLRRPQPGHEDAIPNLASLRESGSLEMDADVVMLIHQRVHALRAAKPKQRPGEGEMDFQKRFFPWEAAVEQAGAELDLWLAKNRHGGHGRIVLGIDWTNYRVLQSVYHKTEC